MHKEGILSLPFPVKSAAMLALSPPERSRLPFLDPSLFLSGYLRLCKGACALCQRAKTPFSLGGHHYPSRSRSLNERPLAFFARNGGKGLSLLLFYGRSAFSETLPSYVLRRSWGLWKTFLLRVGDFSPPSRHVPPPGSDHARSFPRFKETSFFLLYEES